MTYKYRIISLVEIAGLMKNDVKAYIPADVNIRALVFKTIKALGMQVNTINLQYDHSDVKCFF